MSSLVLLLITNWENIAAIVIKEALCWHDINYSYLIDNSSAEHELLFDT